MTHVFVDFFFLESFFFSILWRIIQCLLHNVVGPTLSAPLWQLRAHTLLLGLCMGTLAVTTAAAPPAATTAAAPAALAAEEATAAAATAAATSKELR